MDAYVHNIQSYPSTIAPMSEWLGVSLQKILHQFESDLELDHAASNGVSLICNKRDKGEVCIAQG